MALRVQRVLARNLSSPRAAPESLPDRQGQPHHGHCPAGRLGAFHNEQGFRVGGPDQAVSQEKAVNMLRGRGYSETSL